MRVSLPRPTSSWKARGLLALAVAGLWFTGPWSVEVEAQVGPSFSAASFPACVRLQVEGVLASSPDAEDRNFFADPDDLLEAVWLCAGNYALSAILPIGYALLGGVVVIMIIWTGVGFMFSGELDMGKLLGTLFLAGFGFIMLDNYFFVSEVTWLPGAQPGRGIVGLFSEEAVEMSELIMGDADTRFQRSFALAMGSTEDTERAVRARIEADPNGYYRERINEPWPDESIGAMINRWKMQLRLAPLYFLKWFASVVLWLVGWMIYAQYVWGFFCLAVLTMLGPLFIPWMMIPQLDFLFWGWVKAMINGVIYMLTAAAMYAAVAMLLVVPLARVAQAPIPDDPGSLMGLMDVAWRLGTEYLPMVLMSLLAALKVNALAAMIVAGGGPVASGLSSRISQAESGTLGAMAAGSWLGNRFGSGGANAPLSTTTGAQQAYQEGRRRAGGGSRPGGGGAGGGGGGGGGRGGGGGKK